jgi:hypothetical protein
MATDVELYELCEPNGTDIRGPDFRKNITASLCRAAFTLIDGGATGTTEEKFAKRKWAGGVLYNPQGETVKAARILCYKNHAQTTAFIVGVSEDRAQLDAQTSSIVDELIQTYAGKDATG